MRVVLLTLFQFRCLTGVFSVYCRFGFMPCGSSTALPIIPAPSRGGGEVLQLVGEELEVFQPRAWEVVSVVVGFRHLEEELLWVAVHQIQQVMMMEQEEEEEGVAEHMHLPSPHESPQLHSLLLDSSDAQHYTTLVSDRHENHSH